MGLGELLDTKTLAWESLSPLVGTKENKLLFASENLRKLSCKNRVINNQI
jgi:hypothetical protein